MMLIGDENSTALWAVKGASIADAQAFELFFAFILMFVAVNVLIYLISKMKDGEELEGEE